MLLRTEHRNLSASGTVNSEEFKVQANTHMMEILSGLYSDIPWAIVREYGTNMLDGYIALPPDAKIIPPQIHLPTALEPYIEFKDFGVGMDFETVWQVYKTYGASTKTGNNEEVGGFGLGAKTAFCYEGCDSWAVESRFNGKRMIFSAARNEKGVPTLFHVSTLDTEEHNGVTVRIPVDYRDMTEFRNAVERLVEFYPMDLQVTGDKQFETYARDYVLKGKKWALSQSGVSYVVMGNVPYPLEPENLPGLPYRLRSIISYLGLVLWVPVGAVDIVPSREALKYNGRTSKYIREVALEAFEREVVEVAAALLGDKENEWEALVFLKQISALYGLRDYFTNIQWRGKNLDLLKGITLDFKPLKARFPDLVVERAQGHNYRGSFKKENVDLTKGESLSPYTHPNVGFLVNDLTRGKVGRIKEFIANRSEPVTRYLFKAEGITEKDLASIVEGIPVLGGTSSLPAPYREPREKKERKAASVKVLSSGEWTSREVDIETGGYFARLASGIALDMKGIEKEPGYLASVLGLVPEGTCVYGIPRNLKSIEEKEGWKDFIAEIKPKVEELVKVRAADMEKRKSWDEIRGEYLFRALYTVDSSRLNEGTTAFEIVKEMAEYATSTDEHNDWALVMLADCLRVDIPYSEEYPSYAEDRIASLLKEYPMLCLTEALSYHTPSKQNSDHIVEYIRQTDWIRKNHPGS